MSCLATRSAPLQMERGSKKNRRIRLAISVLGISVLYLLNCTSGSEFDQRNKEIFDEAAKLSSVAFTTTPLTFDGNIQALRTAIIDNTADNNETNCGTLTGCPTTIEGVVSIPSNYGFAISNAGATERDSGCSGPDAVIDKIYARSFVLHDGNAGILVAYGLEPPEQALPPGPPTPPSAKYILHARNPGVAVFGSRIRLSVLKVQKYYGVGATGALPVVTDFNPTTVTVISTGNPVYYQTQSSGTAFTRVADLYNVRRLEGYVTSAPKYVECPSENEVPSSQRQFQYNYQQGFMGTICVGATSYQDAQTCTGTKRAFNFQLSAYLGAGTLSGFDTGDMFSYNINIGAKVRMTGPIFTPRYNQTDANLTLMLGQRLQVETIP